MRARALLVVGTTLGLLVPSAPVLADTGGTVPIRVVVTGRLLDKSAMVRIYDHSGQQAVRVGHSRTVRVRAGSVTIVPAPINGSRASTATVQRITAESGAVVRIRYGTDTTSLPGPIGPLATGADGEPAFARGWVLSPDKAHVAFTSTDPRLLSAGEGSGLFVRDLTTGQVTEVAGEARGAVSWAPDSRRIAFVSRAGLVPQDSNGMGDVYVTDSVPGHVQLASVQSDGTRFFSATGGAWQDGDTVVFAGCDTAEQADSHCAIHRRNLSTGETDEILPAGYRVDEWQLGPDGRHLVFESASDPLDLGIARRALYIKDLATSTTEVLSRNEKGHLANGPAWGAVWSPDSRAVAFRSSAGNLVRGDTNQATDVFVVTRNSGQVTRVSTRSSGGQLYGEPRNDEPALQWAPDSAAVAFRFSAATRPTGSVARTVFIKHIPSGKLEPLIPRRFTIPRSPLVDGWVFSPSGNRIAFRFGPHNGCLTDLIPYANLNCHTILVRDIRNDRLANVSTLDSGLGWLGGPQDRGGWSPAWLSERTLLFLAPDRTPREQRGAAVPLIKTVRWATINASPAPWTPPWCDPNRYWWSC